MKGEKKPLAETKRELDELIDRFFGVVSFQEGEQPTYDELYNLYIGEGLLIKNSTSEPEIFSVSQFIEPREKLANSGQLTAFRETELSEITEIFGNVAHRFSTYEKSGVQDGVAFTARGMISTQFIKTPGGWKISALAWDDERPGLTIPKRYEPSGSSAPGE